jgi:hypothetical protein
MRWIRTMYHIRGGAARPISIFRLLREPKPGVMYSMIREQDAKGKQTKVSIEKYGS